METPEEKAEREENERLRAEVVAEMKAEESGEAPVVDAASAAQKTEPEKKVDPWEGVNPALKQVFDDMSSHVVNLQVTETRLKQAESRIGAITNELSAAKRAAETAKVAPTPEQMAAAAESDEKWESLKKDFPEWADAFDSRFDKKLTVKLDELKKEMGGGKTTDDIETLKTTLREGTATEIQKGILTFFKPKWKDTVASKEWQEWLAMQPNETKSLVQSEQAADAVTILDAFEATQMKKTATEIAAERKQRIKTAVLPQGGKAVPVKSEADMSVSELRANIGKEVYAET